MFKRIDHVEIIPSDIDRTLDFYVSILGFKVRERFPVPMPPMKEIAYLELNGTTVELIGVARPDVPSIEPWPVGYRAIALEVDDMDKAIGYLKEKGVSITWGPVATGRSKRAEIRDPDGLPIELRQW